MQELKAGSSTQPAKSLCPLCVSGETLPSSNLSRARAAVLWLGRSAASDLSSSAGPPGISIFAISPCVCWVFFWLSHSAITFPFRILPCWWFSSLVQYFTFISIEFQLPSVTRTLKLSEPCSTGSGLKSRTNLLSTQGSSAYEELGSIDVFQSGVS